MKGMSKLAQRVIGKMAARAPGAPKGAGAEGMKRTGERGEMLRNVLRKREAPKGPPGDAQYGEAMRKARDAMGGKGRLIERLKAK